MAIQDTLPAQARGTTAPTATLTPQLDNAVDPSRDMSADTPGDADARESGQAPGTATATTTAAAAVLTPRQQRMLVFEREWWRYAASRDDAIRAEFEVKPARYERELDALIDDDRALTVDPMLVKRLRRMRAARQRAQGSGLRRTGSTGR